MKLSINQSQIAVAFLPKATYESKVNGLVSAVVARSKKVCYISINKPYSVLGESFKKSKIDTKKILFIDCVTGKVSGDSKYNVLVVSSPKALTELSIVIGDAIKKPENFVVFDSLSTLLAYHDSSTAIKFIHSLVSKIRSTKNGCIFICLKEDKDSELMKDVSMFVDKMFNA